MTTHAASSQAGLASFRPAPQPVTIYAAVIEWPSDLGEPPALIASRNRDNLISEAQQTIAHMLAAMVPDSTIMRDFRQAFESDPDNFIDHIAAYDGPFITFYERTV